MVALSVEQILRTHLRLTTISKYVKFKAMVADGQAKLTKSVTSSIWPQAALQPSLAKYVHHAFSSKRDKNLFNRNRDDQPMGSRKKKLID